MCTVPQTPKARRIVCLAGDPTAPQSHQKLTPGPAVLPGADGEIWSSLGLLAQAGGDHKDPELHFRGKRVQGRTMCFRKHLAPKQNGTRDGLEIEMAALQ